MVMLHAYLFRHAVRTVLAIAERCLKLTLTVNRYLTKLKLASDLFGFGPSVRTHMFLYGTLQ